MKPVQQLEENVEKNKYENYKWLAIPVMIFFWSLEVAFLFKHPQPNNFVSFDIVLQMFMFYMIIILLFVKKIDLLVLLGATILGVNLDTTFFSQKLHPFLIEHHLYPSFVGYGNTSNQSPEFARICVAILLALGFLVLLTLKHRRTFSRIFAFLIYTSILLTSFLFHYVTILGVKHQTQDRQQVYQMVLRQNNYMQLCQELNLICWKQQFNTLEPTNVNLKLLSPQMQSVSQEMLRMDIMSGQFEFIPQNKVLGDDRNKSFLIGLYNQGREKRFLIDSDTYAQDLMFYQKIYSILALVAHGVWIIGGLFLVWWHEKRKRKKINFNALVEEKRNHLLDYPT